MSKKITFGTKPQTAPVPTADEWVARATNDTGETKAASNDSIGGRNGGAANSDAAPAPTEPMKRLTIDIPAALHTRVKSQCALRGIKMADEVRVLLENRFPEGEG